MAIKYMNLQAVAEIDTTAKTLSVLLTLPAADGEGDVVVSRQAVDLTGPANADRRRKLRLALADPA